MKVLLLTWCFDETIKDCYSVCTWVSEHSNTCVQLMPKLRVQQKDPWQVSKFIMFLSWTKPVMNRHKCTVE